MLMHSCITKLWFLGSDHIIEIQYIETVEKTKKLFGQWSYLNENCLTPDITKRSIS